MTKGSHAHIEVADDSTILCELAAFLPEAPAVIAIGC